MKNGKQEINSQKDLNHHIQDNYAWFVKCSMVLLFFAMLLAFVFISIYGFMLIKTGDIKLIAQIIAGVAGWILFVIQTFKNKKPQ